MSHTTRKLQSTMDKVAVLLWLSNEYKNDDQALVVRYWWDELKDKNISVKDFFTEYKGGKFTPADRITRARRKLQEFYPLLRGKKWKPRKDEEDDTRTDIHNIG